MVSSGLSVNGFLNSFLLLLSLLVLQLCSCSHFAASESAAVKFLPGFQGPLPFHLETGYVGVGESENVQLFYYYVRSETNPREDPLMLWLTGGPGCSALSGLIFEIGPLLFKLIEYNGSLPALQLNPYSWTKMASIIFVDLPVGTGFSYARTARALHSSDLQLVDEAYEFMRKWLAIHPEFISNPFYVGGDSYSGITVPMVTQLIANGNEAGIEPYINLKGYVLGNPSAFPGQENYRIQFAHGMGILPDEYFESLKRSCGSEYRSAYIDPSNVLCLQAIKAFDECTDGLNFAHILENSCDLVSPRPTKLLLERRALDEKHIDLHSPLSAFHCRVDVYRFSYYWADDARVRNALHIRKGSIGSWKRCNYNLPYTAHVVDSRPYHLNLSKQGYRSLVYSGDHDMLMTHQSTQAWIQYLNYSVVDEWRSWKINGQIAGYTRSYSNRMTFATIKGGGHTAPEYRPEECHAMFKRWISHEPL